jgi:hypothetical protein
MTTITEKMTAEEAYTIALNDPIARITNKSSLEDAIKTHRGYAVWYARDVIKGRWIECEDIIKTSPEHVYSYAIDVIKGRWIECEDIIKTSPKYAYSYARCVIKGRWIEGENIIATDPKCAYDYCHGVVRSRCEAVERHIINTRSNFVNYGYWGDIENCTFYSYAKFLGGENGFHMGAYHRNAFCPKHIHEAIKCYYHVIDVVKGRWVEGESIIQQFDTVWKMYQEEFVKEDIPPVDTSNTELEDLKKARAELDAKIKLLETQVTRNKEDKIYVECSCGSPEHLLQFDRDEDFVYIYILLNNENFFKRIWLGLKYIFGYKCRYGNFDEILLSKESVKSLAEYLGEEK